MYNKSERRTPWAAVVPWPRTFSTLSPLLPWNTPAVKWRRWLMSVDRGWFTSLSAGHLFYLFSASIALWAQSAPLLSHQQLLFSLSQSHHHYLYLFLCCHVLQPSISFSHPSVNLLFPVLSPLLFLSGASPISPTPAATWSNYLSPRPGQMWCFLIKIRKGKWELIAEIEVAALHLTRQNQCVIDKEFSYRPMFGTRFQIPTAALVWFVPMV